ncbi:CoB--CoM heterodisulfide reductase subunit B [Methanolapillus millepedarum]|uniref:8-methylmenaquinol:fumarate reductase membrane anchor subunit n=1 Tax=Methanolapillus millepedarum TaxID=3028296 RepID=A0AA96V385_9EURY|nr:8-methylmenaquinol:fumarate reductase membrane anchor subunit [Methanosarcinaceae archaeon Ac7]
MSATESKKENQSLSLFLGCVAPNRYPGIELASRRVMKELGVDLQELKGASCCPAPGVFKSFDKTTWLTLASRNIVLSEQMGMDLLTVCNGCFGSLGEANHTLKHDPDHKKEVNDKLSEIGMSYQGSIEVRHIMEFLAKDVGADAIKEKVTVPLEGIKVAVHYGCHLIRPSKEKEGLGSAENPRFFDDLVNATGAKSVDYEDKLLCCGAGGGARSAFLDTTLKMTEKKLDILKREEYDCIVDACPFCHLQFDSGQVQLKKTTGKDYNIPVLHYAQLLGLAFGHTPQELGIQMNMTCNPAFEQKILALSQKKVE